MVGQADAVMTERLHPLVLQVLSCLSVLSHTLWSEGLCLDDVVFVHLYLRDMSAFSAVNQAYCRSFGDHPPSRSCVQAPLPPGCLVS